MNILTRLKLLTLFFFILTGSAAADQVGRYLTTQEVKTQMGVTVPIGSDVEMLGVIDVSKDISASGRLATFSYQGRIFNADAAAFAKAGNGSNFAAAPFSGRDDGNSAALCTTLIPANTDDILNLADTDLEQFIQVYQDRQLLSGYAVQKPKDAFGYHNRDTEFCVSGLPYSANYKLTLLKDLPARTRKGEMVKLNKSLTFYAATPDKTPTIQVSAAQNILPMRDEAVIPFSATNVKDVTVDIFRVDPRSLTNSYDVFQILDGYGAKRLDKYLGDKIGSEKLTLDADKNSTKSYNINLTSLLKTEPAGLYVAVFKSEDLDLASYQKRPTQWFMRSDVAISVYSGLKHSDIFLSNFGTADPVSGAEISIIAQNNKILTTGASDNKGRLRVNRQLLKGTGGHAPEYLMVQGSDDSLTILPLDNLEQKPRHLNRGLKKGDAEDIYLTSDREMYRAGETVHVFMTAKDNGLSALPGQEFILQLSRSDGAEIERQIVTSDDNGALSAKFDLKSSSRLGRYEIHLSSMDERRLETHKIRVEDFVPLTIDPGLETAQSSWKNGEASEVALTGEYYSGGPANGLQGEVVAQLFTLRYHEKEDLKDFVFGTAANAEALKTDYYSGLTLDAKGSAKVTLPNAYKITDPGLYQVRLTGRVFDVGGRPNGTRLSLPLDTGLSYVGVRSQFGEELDEGTAPSFEIVNIDRNGNEVSLEGIKYRLAKVTYSYDSYYDDGWRWRKSRLQDTVIETGSVSSRNLSLKSALNWGAYEISLIAKDGMTTNLEFYAGWGGDQSPTTEPEALSLSLEREADNTAIVRFTAPFSGKLRLMTASTDVQSIIEMRVEKGDVETELQLPSNVEPGIHVLATLIRPVTENSEHLPQYAVGSVWSPYLGDARIIETKLTAPDKIRSSDEVPVTLELDQKDASAILFMVDEGIHGLTGYQNIDLKDHYYRERQLALGLITNFGQLIRQDRSLQTFKVGGDGDLASSASRQQSDFFKTVAEASPLLKVVDGKVSHTFEKTEFEGRLRLVALVVSKSGVGFAQKSITLQDPVSLDISLPRFIGVGDEIEGRLALRGNEGRFDVTLNRTIGTTSESFTKSLSAGDRIEAPLPIASKGPGRLPILIENKFGDQTIQNEFDLTARLTSYPVIELHSVPLAASDNGEEALTRIPPLLSHAFSLSDSAHATASLNLAPVAGAGIADALSGLDRYPYGCVEQVSSGTRGLIARAKQSGNQEDLSDKINHGIDQIIAKQKNSGAFGYWDRSGDIYAEYQPYALETLIMAREYANDQKSVETAIKKGLDYLYGQNPRNVKTKLYAYGLLIDQGYEVTSRARYTIDHQLNLKGLLYRRKGNEYPNVREKLERLSLAYWVASKLQDKFRLRDLTAQFETALNQQPKQNDINRPVGKWTTPVNLVKQSDWRRSGSAPQFANLLTKIAKEHRNAPIEAVIDNTLRDLAAQRYRSTDINAKLVDLYLYKKNSLAGKNINIDGETRTIRKDGTLSISLSQLRRGIDIRHNFEQAITLNAELVGLRETAGVVDNGFQVRKFWADAKGNPISLEKTRLVAKQGDLFSVTIEIQPSRSHVMDDLLLTDLLPSGFEIEDAVLPRPTKLMDRGKLRDFIKNRKKKYPSYSQNMDDRFMAHFKGKWGRKDIAYITYVVRAAYPGKMTIPDAQVEFMYAPAINGRSEFNWAEVQKGS
ncbi:MAG: hypothetical protein JJ879_13130 [Sneathiella sp.]|nr:hypothetical protein [Sneathiella sp.]